MKTLIVVSFSIALNLALLCSSLSAQTNDSPSLRSCANSSCTHELPESGNPEPRVSLPTSFAISERVAEVSGGGVLMAKLANSNGLSGLNYSVGLNFLGVGNGFSGYTVQDVTPMIAMAVGDTQVVQWVENSYAVFDKTTGTPLTGAISASTLFSALGGPCAYMATAQASIHWDRAAHRWLIARNTTGRLTCVAVSNSADATGGFYLYAYPRGGTGYALIANWGIWSNGYYKAQDEYDFRGTYLGANLCGYNRSKMLVGDPSAEEICLPLSANDFSPVPADVDSNVPPPAGQDELFAAIWDQTHLAVYAMHADFATPANSFVTGSNGSQLLEVPAFTPGCDHFYSDYCVPQKGNSMQLEVLSGRLGGGRIAYWDDTPPTGVRATPPHPAPLQHWYFVHDSKAAGGNQAPRWYEFTAPQHNTPPTGLHLFQSGTFAPDADNHRWTAAIARDKKYNILMGYSISSTTIHPSIAITGRTLQDPLGTMEDELMVMNGSGSDWNLDWVGYWGWYSAMSLDPDGCTFFYSNQYFLTDSPAWSTQIASVKFSNCD